MRYLIILLVTFITTSSFATTFKGKFIQGSFIIGKTDPGTKVIIDSIIEANEDSLTKYMKENFVNV